MLKGCWSVISGFLAIIGLILILRDCGFFKTAAPLPLEKPGQGSNVTPPAISLPSHAIEPEKKLLAQLPKYKVTAREGFTINLLVPENTTREQLKALIQAFREARIQKSFSKLIPPTKKPWYNGEYSRIFIQIFDEPEWATGDKLKFVLGEGPGPGNVGKFNNEYNRHIRAEYVYETARNNLWSETGTIGFSELGFRSGDFEELFSKPLYP